MLQILPNGLRRRFTLLSFAVPSALLAARMPLRFGLIVDRQYTLSLTVGSGKNFTAASVVMYGGLGVAIDLLLNLCVKMRALIGALMMIFRIMSRFSILFKIRVRCALRTLHFDRLAQVLN